MKLPKNGFEPLTPGFSIQCSTGWAIWAQKLKKINGQFHQIQHPEYQLSQQYQLIMSF